MYNKTLENDVILQYGNRVIQTPEGKISLNELMHAEEDTFGDSIEYIYNNNVKVATDSRDFTDKGIVVYRHKKDKALITGCVTKYFQPKKSYWKLNNKSSCQDVAKAYGIPDNYGSCFRCFKNCITTGCKLKYPARVQKLVDKVVDSYDD